MLSFIKKLSNVLNSIAEKFAIFLISVLTIITTTGVMFRYVFKSPIMWLYETTVLVFAWTVFFGVSIAFKRKEHIRLDFLVDALSSRGKSKGVRVIISILVMIFLGIAIAKGLTIISNTINQKYNTIDLSVAWFYAAFPVSAVFALVHMLEQTIEIITGKEEIKEKGV